MIDISIPLRSGSEKIIAPILKNHYKKKGLAIPPAPYLLHRDRVIDIPDIGEGDRCDRRVEIVKRICLDLF